MREDANMPAWMQGAGAGVGVLLLYCFGFLTARLKQLQLHTVRDTLCKSASTGNVFLSLRQPTGSISLPLM